MGKYFGDEHPCDFFDKKCVDNIIKILLEQFNATRPVGYHATFDQLKLCLKIGDMLNNVDKSMHICSVNLMDAAGT